MRQPEVSRREILNWERELIGLYVSDHPLSPVMEELTEAVTHFSGAAPRSRSPGAGARGGDDRAHPPAPDQDRQIDGFRHHGRSAGDDRAGDISQACGIRFNEIIEHDKIVLVDGKVDMQSGEPKVLVDTVSTDFTVTRSIDPPPICRTRIDIRGYLDRSIQPAGSRGNCYRAK